MQTLPRTASQCIPLPAALAAVWGAFLYEGLLAHSPDHQRTRSILDAWREGCIELVISACAHLPEVWEQISSTWNETDVDFPGVFEYEVISPFGEWLGDYLLAHDGHLPDTESVRQKLQELIRGFLPAQAA
jgi:hypothetical protein